MLKYTKRCAEIEGHCVLNCTILQTIFGVYESKDGTAWKNTSRVET